MIGAVGTTLVVFVCAIRAADVAPATRPATPATTASTQPASTRPAGVILRGKVSIDAGWTLQKPDLSRVVVYLSSDSILDARPWSVEHATIAQKNKAFIPNFLVVPRGTNVEFPNWDDFDHNVFSRSKAAPAFDLDRYPRGMSKTRTFDKLGVVQVFCNIHPAMRAIIYVTPNQFFARPDADGNFEIQGVPPGNFELTAWHERCEEQRQPLVVTAGQPGEVSITLKESRGRALATENDRRASYGGVERGLGIKRERLNLPVVTDSHPAPKESKP
jgi:plastocyanin